jgi:hypothetical protein
VQEGNNREYPVSGISATGLRLRGEDGVPMRNIQIYNNTIIATTGPGFTNECYAARIVYKNTNGAMANSNITITNNTFRGIVTTTDSSYHAYAFDVDSLDAGIGLNIRNNVFDSNEYSVRLCSPDDWNISQLDLVGNTFSLSSSGAVRTYTAVLAGYWVGTVTGVRLIDSRFANGATLNVFWSGQGTKDISICSLLDVATVGGTSGTFLSGSAINVTSGGQGASGATASDGQFSNIVVALTTYSQLTSDPTQITMTQFDPFTINATLGGITMSEVVVLTGNFTLDPAIPGS